MTLRPNFLLLITLAAALLGAGCDKLTDPTACGAGFNPDAENAVGDFGTNEAALKVEAFLSATARLHKTSLNLESDLLDACRAMAADLGIPEAELAPQNGELPVTAACSRVSTEIESIIATGLPVDASLVVTFTPPVCEVDLSATAECAAECDVTIEGSAQVECTGGELSGGCEGTCEGYCEVEVAAMCEGTCTGQCSGECNGYCDGACAAENAMGQCEGSCEGTCEGSCTASCMGTCTTNVMASCMGTCTGSCDVEFTAPKCTGEANVTADADCKAACEAEASAEATCTEPTVAVAAAVAVDEAAQARIDALIATLIENYPTFVRASAQLEVIASSSAEVASNVDEAAEALVDAGVQAVACMANAVTVAADAAARVSASVEVNVEVSASVSASGEATAN